MNIYHYSINEAQHYVCDSCIDLNWVAQMRKAVMLIWCICNPVWRFHCCELCGYHPVTDGVLGYVTMPQN